MNSKLGGNGFTLLEVLIALVIIVIATTASFQAISSSSKTQQKLQDGTFGRWIAATEMANIQLGLTQPTVGETHGTTRMAGRLWQWQRQVTVAADPALRRVHIAVTAEQGGGINASLVAFVPADQHAGRNKQ